MIRGLILLVTVGGAVAAPAFGQVRPSPSPPTFGVEIQNIYVDAFVTQHGRPLTGLVASDFELRDNGVLQRLELAAADSQPLLAVLAFDVSNSLEGEKLAQLRAASAALLDSLRAEDEATLFSFTDDVRWMVKPTRDKASVSRALAGLEAGGGTAIMDALYAALTLPPTGARSLLVLFTDGADNASWLDWKQVQKVAERSNTTVHVVSLSPPRLRDVRSMRELKAPAETADFGIRSVQIESAVDVEFEGPWSLRQIAESTGGRYWEAESSDRLKAAFAAIAEAMGKRYVLRYAPDNIDTASWHKIELKLRGKKGDVHARSGYWVRSPAPSGRE